MAKLSELVQQAKEIREEWPGGINFKTKSRFAGFHHDGIGGIPDAVISIEMLESDQWAPRFVILDKEFTTALFGSGPFKAQESPFDHPCRQTCSGWIQGYERGRSESAREIEFLKKICRSFASASRNKHTKLIVESLGRHYETAAKHAAGSEGK